MFTLLHVKSHFSLGVGTASVEALVREAQRHGYATLGLTDVENLYGQVEHHKTCRNLGIAPITGVELHRDFSPDEPAREPTGRVVLLAKNREGYRTLCRVVSRRRARRGGPQEDPLDSLGESAEGVFLLTDDPDVLDTACRRYGPGDVHTLLVRPRVAIREPALLERARAWGVSPVGSLDVTMLSEEDAALQRLAAALHSKRRARKPAPARLAMTGGWLRSPEDAVRLFDDSPDALRQSTRLAESCAFDPFDSPRVSPRVPGIRADEAHATLVHACSGRLAEARARGALRGARYDARLESELRIIESMDLSSTFLVIAEILAHAAGANVPVAGRGSAVGSFVAHLLGLSPVDPVDRELYFERFVHPGRLDPPDFDIDVASSQRDGLIQWVLGHFGRRRAAQVGVVQRYQRRAAYREALSALGASAAEMTRFSQRLPADDLIDAGLAPHWAETLPPGFRRQRPVIERLIGMPRHMATHPGGVVIVDRDVSSLLPLERTTSGARVTQYDAEAIAELGLLKIDLLGNHCLDEIAETDAWLAQGGAPATTAALPENDAETLATVSRAATIGCFQLETPAVRAVLKRLPVQRFEDIVAALAIVRPGPASGEAKAAFIRRARGEAPPIRWNAALDARLGATYGLFLYEEDVLFALTVLTGRDAGFADALRADLVRHQNDTTWLERTRRELVRLAIDRGHDEPLVSAVWQELSRFAAYSFSKAHASSYAHLAYHAAYLKTHAPIEFGCAVLNRHAGSYPKRVLASDLARIGVRLLAPSVKRSSARCTVETIGSPSARAIRVGLSSTVGLQSPTVERLLLARAKEPFSDLADLLRRTALSRKEIEALVLSGACDELAPLSTGGYPWLHEHILQALSNDSAADLAALGSRLRPVEARGDPAHIALFQQLARVSNELRFLEMHVSDHPMRLLRPEANRSGCVTTARLPSLVGQRVQVAGIIAATRKVPSPNGVTQFVTIEDEHGMVEGVLFTRATARLDEAIATPGPYLVAGKVADEQGDRVLLVDDLIPFHRRADPYGVGMRI